MERGYGQALSPDLAIALQRLLLRLLIQRVENRRVKGDLQLSSDDEKALHYAKEALAEWDAAHSDPCRCCVTPDEARKMVGG